MSGTPTWKTRPIFVTSTFRDMQAERTHLREVVFPALQDRLREAFQPVGLLDLRLDVLTEAQDEQADRDPLVLKVFLADVERSRPLLICLVGDRYGGVPPADCMIAATREAGFEPEMRGHSVTDLKIRYGVLDNPEQAERSWFYFRAPLPYDRMPLDVVAVYSDQHSHIPEQRALAPLLDALKAEIRARIPGRVREYTAEWDEQTHQVVGLDAWGRQVADDLWPELEREATRALQHHSTSHEPATKLDDNVQFTAYRPRSVQPQKWYPLLVFAHLSERRADAPDDEPDPVREVKRQASEILKTQVEAYQPLTQDSRQSVPREGELSFIPEVAGFEFNPPQRTFRWTDESVHREEFRMRASAELDGKAPARGQLSVYFGAILLSEIQLTITVSREACDRAETDAAEPATARPYRKIFASYSHRDAEIVDRFDHFVRAMGDQYLRDCIDLRAGEVWSDRIAEMIRECDVFQLFWSSNSMGSGYVRQEWEYALSLPRPQFVRPVYWETPMPEAPDEDLPPEALRKLHFQCISSLHKPDGTGSREPAGTRDQEMPSGNCDRAVMGESSDRALMGSLERRLELKKLERILEWQRPPRAQVLGPFDAQRARPAPAPCAVSDSGRTGNRTHSSYRRLGPPFRRFASPVILAIAGLAAAVFGWTYGSPMALRTGSGLVAASVLVALWLLLKPWQWSIRRIDGRREAARSSATPHSAALQLDQADNESAVSDLAERVRTELKRADDLLIAGMAEESLTHYRSVLAAIDRLPPSVIDVPAIQDLVQTLLMNTGEANARLDRHKDAMPYFSRALAISVRLHARGESDAHRTHEYAVALINVTDTHLRLGHPQIAASCARRCRQLVNVMLHERVPVKPEVISVLERLESRMSVYDGRSCQEPRS